MKNKYGIGFFTIFIVIALLLTCAYQIGFRKVQERERETRMEEAAEKKYEKSVSTDGNVLSNNCYYLMEVNGYIVVYLSDKKTVYEYTNICYDELPEKLRREIRNGKYVKDTDALYGFLENYSS